MSVRKGFVLLVALSALAFLIACGGNGPAPVNPTPPPTGGFSNANLNGTYVFSISGTDVNGASLAIAGTLIANGSGTITGGTIDINDAEFTSGSAPGLKLGSSSYDITVDGRGQTKINLPNNPFGGNSPFTFDFVLQDNSHGYISEFDQNGTGSGTLDLQSSGTPTGAYAFIFSGVPFANPNSLLATVGNFSVAAGGGITGTLDGNEVGNLYSSSLSGKVVLGPSPTPSTTFTTSSFSTQTFDVIAIDSTHLKFIEMDQFATLSGDAFSEPSSTVPTGTLSFTVTGEGNGVLVTAGGLLVTDGAGNITSASNADSNNSNNGPSVAPVGFTGTYAATPSGSARYVLALTGFTQGTSYVAYPSTGGLLLLEADSSGVMVGAAYAQTPGATLGVPDGFALNLSGENLGQQTGQPAEIDDIAEFATASGGNVTGIIDENSAVQTVVSIPLDGQYATPSGGRGAISASANNGTNGTLEGVLNLTYYPVDSTTFPFIEMDAGQVSTGVFVLQSSSSSNSAVAKSHAMYVPHPLFHPHSARQKKN
ncbi:MAG: hypothetical protein WCF22_13970 [Candidatus Sulfotelmatobacter sp.]